MKSVVLIALLLASAASAKNILVFFPVPSPSVAIIGHSLGMELAHRGHNVTIVTVHPSGKVVPRYWEIIIPLPKEHKALTETAMGQAGLNFFKVFSQFLEMSIASTEKAFTNPEVKYLMEDEAHFDLVVSSFALTTFQQGIAAHFKCPYVILTSIPAPRFILEMLGQGANPEAVPNFIAGYTEPMTMWERVVNMFFNVAEYALYKYVDYKNKVIYDRMFPGPRYPDFDDMKKNLSLALVNSHFSQNSVRPFLPSIVEVGGIQTKQKPDPLPEDIEKWITGASEGVVLVSLGSNLKSSKLPEDKLQILLNTFRSLKQRVIWKFEAKKIPDLPPNVMVQPWLPQDDILAHPNTRLFITHFGISSYNEALFHGVPAVGIPFVGDQPVNARRAFDAGWAEVVPYSDLTQEALDSAVQKVLGNPSYKNTVQKLADIYRDRPMTPLETAVYWVEYVIRHRGAPQLQYQGADLSLWQKTSLDVWAFVLVWIWILFKGVIFGLAKVLCCRRSRSESGGKKGKKSKKE